VRTGETEADADAAPGGALRPEDVLADRAAAFLEKYQTVLYPQYRNGAKYLKRRPALDFAEACRLCETWDDERLEKLAVLFLTTNHPFAKSGSRTMGQFAVLASLMDNLLHEWEDTDQEP
jgi:hypothetical protein